MVPTTVPVTAVTDRQSGDARDAVAWGMKSDLNTHPRSRRRYPAAAAAIAAVALFTAACGSSSSSPSTSTETAPVGVGPTSTGGGGMMVDVQLQNYKITKLPMHLKPGKYTFHVTNKGPSSHNLTITGPGLSAAHTPTFAAGGSENLTVTLKNGSYDFFCSIPGHKQLGLNQEVMVGSGGGSTGGGTGSGSTTGSSSGGSWG